MLMADRFREQAAACAGLGSPMYGHLLHRLAADIENQGASADVLAGHEQDAGPSALALRLVGSVHRLVLAGGAPELATCYPSVGGSWDPHVGWTAFERVLRDQPDEAREWLDQPPQTNEVGRAAALMGGLLRIGETVAWPIRLLEIGSSAGLNLRADKFCYRGFGGWEFGPRSSPVRLDDAWRGRRLESWDDLAVVERIGSDVAPVDVATAPGRLTLLSYVWPDQPARISRLRNAFAVATVCPAEVRREDACSFVRGVELVERTTTVLWHSVMWQYLSRREQREVSNGIETLGASATSEMPFAHLILEPARRRPGAAHEFLVTLRVWPTGQRRILGSSVGHGVPTTWE